MTKTWETLFHLANFMKYLLYEVLPNEKSSSPQYVLNSLLDLLQTTLECIHNVRDENRKKKENIHEAVEGIAGDILYSSLIQQAQRGESVVTTKQEKQQKYIDVPMDKETHLCNKKNSDHIGGLPSTEENIVSLNSFKGRGENNIDGSIEKERYTDSRGNTTYCEVTKSILLNEEISAHVLEKNIVEKQSCGPLPKDSCIEIEKNCVVNNATESVLLVEEEADSVHRINKNKKKEIQGCSGKPSKKKRNVLNFENSNLKKKPEEGNKKNEQHKVDLLVHEENNLSLQRYCENHSQGFTKDKETLQKICLGSGLVTRHQSIIINKNFIFVNEQVVSGLESYGAFCLPCDKGFFSASDWDSHMNDDYKHSKLPYKEISSCGQCDFFICGNSVVLEVYLDFHATFHNPESAKIEVSNHSSSELHHNKALESQNSVVCCKITQPQSTFRSSLQDLRRTCDSVPFSRTSSSLELNPKLNTSIDLEAKHRRKKAKNSSKEFVFSDKYIEINNKVHDGYTTEAYYCRPCDKVCYSLKDWQVHCKKQRHIAFLQNKNFKNSQASCNYCNMLIIGSRNIAIGYMEHHSTGHDKIPSYELKLISDKDHDQAKLSKNISNSESSHIVQSFQDNCYSETKTEPTAHDISNEKVHLACQDGSWFQEDLISRIKGLFLDRKKKKLSGKLLTFYALCLVCDNEIEDAFEWMDHLELDLHCSKLKENDEELIYREYNVNFFGNKSLIAESLPY